MGIFTFCFFFGDKVNDKENIKKFGFQILILMVIVTIILLVMTIGALSATMATHLSLPFFVVVKNISILDTIERIESVLLALWVLSDFMVITIFALITVSILKSTFGIKETKSFVGPVVLLAGIGSMFLFRDRFELETFSNIIALPTNIVFEFAIPVVVFVIGKIRKRI